MTSSNFFKHRWKIQTTCEKLKRKNTKRRREIKLEISKTRPFHKADGFSYLLAQFCFENKVVEGKLFVRLDLSNFAIKNNPILIFEAECQYYQKRVFESAIFTKSDEK